jgi:hypothetical protein
MSTTSTQPGAGAPSSSSPPVSPAPEALVRIEGQEIPLKEEIVASDALLKKVLRPYYPAIMNASITRRREGERLIATIVKRADYKGARRRVRKAAYRITERRPEIRTDAIIAALKEAPRETNPALELARVLQLKLARGQATFEAIERMGGEIEQALSAGEQEAGRVRDSVRRIRQTRPIPAASLPAGF